MHGHAIRELYPTLSTLHATQPKTTAQKGRWRQADLSIQKGFDILIRCWKEIDKAHPDWRLDIYGEGSLRESLQQQIDQLGLAER